MVDISYLGFSNKEPSQVERRALLVAPYFPFDGMNEYGLTVGLMAVPYADGGNEPQKVTIGGLHAVRLMLDYAKNVEEALALLQNYNIDFRGGPPLHYLVSDSSGNSAVVEFINGEMRIIPKSQPWQVATNFVISDTMPKTVKLRCRRYRKASETLEQLDGKLSQTEARQLLQQLSQPTEYATTTIWSTVYNMTTGEIQVMMDMKYDTVYTFTLKIQSE